MTKLFIKRKIAVNFQLNFLTLFFQIPLAYFMNKLTTTKQQQPETINQKKKLKSIIQKKGLPNDNAFYFPPETIKTKAKLKNSTSMLDDIDNLLNECNNQPPGSNSKSNSPQSHHSRDFFNSTLEAFNEDSSLIIVSDRNHSHSEKQLPLDNNQSYQLQFIQEVFAQFDPPQNSASKKMRSNLSTDCTIESDRLNTSFNDFKQKFEFHETMENQSVFNIYNYDEDYTSFNKFQSNIYEINFDKICTDNRTTLMIRNVPNNYSKEMLIEEIDDRFKGKFDFFNLHYDNQVKTEDINNNKAKCWVCFHQLKRLSNCTGLLQTFQWKKMGQSFQFQGIYCEYLNDQTCQLRYARVQRKQKGIYNELMQNYKRQQCFNNFVNVQKTKPYYQGNNLIQIQQLIQSQREQCMNHY